MSKKLGFKSWKGSTSEEDEQSSDEGLMKRMFAAMGEVQVDFTNFFRSLAKIDSTTGLEEALSIVRSTMGAGAGFDEDAEDEVSDEAVSIMREWLSEYLDRLAVARGPVVTQLFRFDVQRTCTCLLIRLLVWYPTFMIAD